MVRRFCYYKDKVGNTKLNWSVGGKFITQMYKCEQFTGGRYFTLILPTLLLRAGQLQCQCSSEPLDLVVVAVGLVPALQEQRLRPLQTLLGRSQLVQPGWRVKYQIVY